MDLSAFFEDQEIDVVSVVGIGDLPDDDQESVKDFFKDARSVIVFGKEVPAGVYRMPARDKTRGMLRIAESLDRSAKLLAERLNDENIPARPVPLYLPVRISNGKVQGLVRLKHVAAAGGLGYPRNEYRADVSPVRPAALVERSSNRATGNGVPWDRGRYRKGARCRGRFWSWW